MTRLRPDPRALRLRRMTAGQAGRVRLVPAALADRAGQVSPSGRLRRDPRAERQRLLVPGLARARLVRDGRAGTGGSASPVQETRSQVIRIDDPQCLVMVVPDLPDGRPGRLDRQVMGAARLLADAWKGAVVLCCPASLDSAAYTDFAQAGADRVLPLPLDPTDPERSVAAIGDAVTRLTPRTVLFGESTDGGDMARRVAVATGRSFMGDVEVLNPRNAIRPAMARRSEQVASTLPGIMALSPDRVAPYGGNAHEARVTGMDGDDRQSPVHGGGRIRVAPPQPGDPATMALAEAPFVVSAGNGVTDFDMFRQMVSALHASPGGSRMVCDAGLLPREMQVGASGTVLDAICYVAMGISGAPQHLQGLGRVEHVVAVNTDLHAAMVERAGLAIIADAQLVMPALLDVLRNEAEE